jgi:hypothetical protein
MRKRGTFNKMSRAEGEGRLGTREKNREFLVRTYQKELLRSSLIPVSLRTCSKKAPKRSIAAYMIFISSISG